LLQACVAASEKYHTVSAKTKANSDRMNEIAQLEKHIGAYRKTKDIYAEYRRLPAKKQAKFYEQHRSQIVLCEAAKKYFNELGMNNRCRFSSERQRTAASLRKLPSIKELKQEYARLQAENKKLYPAQKQDRAKMLELLTAKSNVQRILGLSQNEQQQETKRQQER